MKLPTTRKPASGHFSMAYAIISIRGVVDRGMVPSPVRQQRGAAADFLVDVVADRGSRGCAHLDRWHRVMFGTNLSHPSPGPTRHAAGRRSGNPPRSRRPAPTQRTAHARCLRRSRRRTAAIPVLRRRAAVAGPYPRRKGARSRGSRAARAGLTPRGRTGAR